MFTGLGVGDRSPSYTECYGRAIGDRGRSRPKDTRIGDSLAVNGCCLTVVALNLVFAPMSLRPIIQCYTARPSWLTTAAMCWART
jgi:riboflavin synthase alpha subunit